MTLGEALERFEEVEREIDRCLQAWEARVEYAAIQMRRHRKLRNKIRAHCGKIALAIEISGDGDDAGILEDINCDD